MPSLDEIKKAIQKMWQIAWDFSALDGSGQTMGNLVALPAQGGSSSGFHLPEQDIYPYFSLLLESLPGMEWPMLLEAYQRTKADSKLDASSWDTSLMTGFPRFLAEASEPAVIKSTVRQFPFLPELAWYEWLDYLVNIEGKMQEPRGFTPHIPQAEYELGRLKPYWNPHCRYHCFSYPITTIMETLKDDFSPSERRMTLWEIQPEETRLLIYRHSMATRGQYYKLTDYGYNLFYYLTPENTYLEGLRLVQMATTEYREVPQHLFLENVLTDLQGFFHEELLFGSCPALILKQ